VLIAAYAGFALMHLLCFLKGLWCSCCMLLGADYCICSAQYGVAAAEYKALPV
jgi:hypothetical protein